MELLNGAWLLPHFLAMCYKELVQDLLSLELFSCSLNIHQSPAYISHTSRRELDHYRGLPPFSAELGSVSSFFRMDVFRYWSQILR